MPLIVPAAGAGCPTTKKAAVEPVVRWALIQKEELASQGKCMKRFATTHREGSTGYARGRDSVVEAAAAIHNPLLRKITTVHDGTTSATAPALRDTLTVTAAVAASK